MLVVTGAFLIGIHAVSPATAHALITNCEIDADGNVTCETSGGAGDGDSGGTTDPTTGGYEQPGEVILVNGEAPAEPPAKSIRLGEPWCYPGPGYICPLDCSDGSVAFDCPSNPTTDVIPIPVPLDMDGSVAACSLNAPAKEVEACVQKYKPVRKRSTEAGRRALQKIASLVKVCKQERGELLDLKQGRDWTLHYYERKLKIKYLEEEFGDSGRCGIFADTM